MPKLKAFISLASNKLKLVIRQALFFIDAIVLQAMSWKTKKYFLRNAAGIDNSILIFSSNNSEFYNRLYLLSAYLLSKYKGALPVILDNKNPATPLAASGVRLRNCLNRSDDLEAYLTRFDWRVDVANGFVGWRRVNVFPYIYNRVNAELKIYQADLGNEEVLRRLYFWSDVSRKIFGVYQAILSDANLGRSKIIFVGRESEYAPDGVLRHLAEVDTSGRVSYAEIGRGYAHYFSGHSSQPKCLVTNCSAEQKSSRMVLHQHDLINDICDADRLVIKKVMDRSARSEPRFLRQLQKLRSGGRRVFILMSHMFYDRPAKDASPAFSSMLDWIDFNIQLFKDRPNDVLLLKPHINEEWVGEESRNPNQLLCEYIGDRLGDSNNIFLLAPRQYSLQDLVPYMDTGLVWRSSAGAELMVMDKPVIVAGPAPYASALNVEIPSTKAQYAQQVETGGSKYDADLATNYIVSLEKAHVTVDVDTVSLLRQLIIPDKRMADWMTRSFPDAHYPVRRSATHDAFRMSV